MLSKGEFSNRLAKRLQALRIQRGLSQEELAEKASLYRTYVGHLENARYIPSAYVIYKISEALEVDPAEIFTL